LAQGLRNLDELERARVGKNRAARLGIGLRLLSCCNGRCVDEELISQYENVEYVVILQSML
jgi:hypothetical protein